MRRPPDLRRGPRSLDSPRLLSEEEDSPEFSASSRSTIISTTTDRTTRSTFRRALAILSTRGRNEVELLAGEEVHCSCRSLRGGYDIMRYHGFYFFCSFLSLNRCLFALLLFTLLCYETLTDVI